jgi:hypothetical protein
MLLAPALKISNALASIVLPPPAPTGPLAAPTLRWRGTELSVRRAASLKSSMRARHRVRHSRDTGPRSQFNKDRSRIRIVSRTGSGAGASAQGHHRGAGRA